MFAMEVSASSFCALETRGTKARFLGSSTAVHATGGRNRLCIRSLCRSGCEGRGQAARPRQRSVQGPPGAPGCRTCSRIQPSSAAGLCSLFRRISDFLFSICQEEAHQCSWENNLGDGKHLPPGPGCVCVPCSICTSSSSGSVTLKMMSACLRTSTEDSATCTPPCLTSGEAEKQHTGAKLCTAPASCIPHPRSQQQCRHRLLAGWRSLSPRWQPSRRLTQNICGSAAHPPELDDGRGRKAYARLAWNRRVYRRATAYHAC